ncbi:MAG TPA: hypothetical protein VMA36_12980 [Candidatus Limnocylindria bacterium]|jgi:hypothetical protein|nr:hypothetical protein [Candidatus Limnocylindria bacterium]
MMFFNAPVTVLACSYNASQNAFDQDGVTVPYASVRVSFQNTASMPVRAVRFEVGEGRTRQTIDDVGTFSPRVAISHELPATPDAFLTGPQRCSVDAVTFADGSHWDRR